MNARVDGKRRADAKPDPIKHCHVCGVRLVRRRINGRLQDLTGFCELRTCSSAECLSVWRTGKKGRLADQLWAKVQKAGPDECWPWIAAKYRKGYGHLNDLGRTKAAHRVAWELTNGAIPDGMFVCHHCDNPSCCNPAHLFLGSAKDNTLDMIRKGRHRTGPNQPNA